MNVIIFESDREQRIAIDLAIGSGDRPGLTTASHTLDHRIAIDPQVLKQGEDRLFNFLRTDNMQHLHNRALGPLCRSLSDTACRAQTTRQKFGSAPDIRG